MNSKSHLELIIFFLVMANMQEFTKSLDDVMYYDDKMTQTIRAFVREYNALSKQRQHIVDTVSSDAVVYNNEQIISMLPAICRQSVTLDEKDVEKLVSGDYILKHTSTVMSDYLDPEEVAKLVPDIFESDENEELYMEVSSLPQSNYMEVEPITTYDDFVNLDNFDDKNKLL